MSKFSGPVICCFFGITVLAVPLGAMAEDVPDALSVE